MTPARWTLAAEICAEAIADGRLGFGDETAMRNAEASLRFLAALDTITRDDDTDPGDMLAYYDEGSR